MATRGGLVAHSWRAAAAASLWLVGLACQSPPAAPATATPAPVRPTVAPTRPLAVAVAVGSPTPTPVLSGDYPTLIRPRLVMVQQGFAGLEQQLAIAQKSPMRMADDDWRQQTRSILQDLLADSADLRTVTSRLAPRSDLGPKVLKLADDVDFVANEFRMALDYDPDATHFIRAARAEKTTADELGSLLARLPPATG